MNIELTHEQAKVLAAAVNYYINVVEQVAETINSRDDRAPYMGTPASEAAYEIRSLDKTLDELVSLFLDIDTSDISEQFRVWKELAS